MSIAAGIAIESRRYSGWIDPRYPIGYWQGALSLVGNASGGIIGLDLVFQPATSPALNRQLYSVERFSATQNDGTDLDYSVAAINMGGPSNVGFLHQYAVRMIGRGGGGSGSLAGNDFTFLPLFLGSQRSPGTTASFTLVGLNILDVLVTFEAEGYRWDPRSILVDGGPQRPPTGLYKA